MYKVLPLLLFLSFVFSLAPLLLFSTFVLSHFLSFFCEFLCAFSFELQDAFINRFRREQCGPTLHNLEKTGPQNCKIAHFFGARFGSEPDKRDVYARRGPGGF